ncbi:MAG: hypothetical protein LBJ44_00380 [Propionibacteriaceae bacterium]|jgi:hypothetical protein|nr:hypothetical protein [Propionibacteriaceae bacterium]
MTDAESNPVEGPASELAGTVVGPDQPRAEAAAPAAKAPDLGPAASMVTGYARRRRVGQAWPRVLGIAVGVPLLAIVVFVVLVASGVVQDRSKREYCRSWSQLADGLGQQQASYTAALADGDRVALGRITVLLIDDLESLSESARATGMDGPVEAMLEHLRAQQAALDENDEAKLAEVAERVDQFVSQSQELLAASVRACG